MRTTAPPVGTTICMHWKAGQNDRASQLEGAPGKVKLVRMGYAGVSDNHDEHACARDPPWTLFDNTRPLTSWEDITTIPHFQLAGEALAMRSKPPFPGQNYRTTKCLSKAAGITRHGFPRLSPYRRLDQDNMRCRMLAPDSTWRRFERTDQYPAVDMSPFAFGRLKRGAKHRDLVCNVRSGAVYWAPSRSKIV